MKAIIYWTVWLRRWSTMWWSVGVAVFMFVTLIFYPSFKNDADELQGTFENIPDAALQLLGGSADFFSPIGYVNSQVYFLMLPLLLGILAIGLGSSLIAREEQDKTIETLLSRPLSRGKLLFAKAIAGIKILTAVSIVGWLAIIATARFVDLEVGIKELTLASFSTLMLTLSFGAVAFMLTSIGRARGAALGLATLYAFGGYLVSSLSATVTWLQTPAKLFTFHYFQSEAVLQGTYNWSNMYFIVGVITVSGAIAWLSFRRRDLA